MASLVQASHAISETTRVSFNLGSISQAIHFYHADHEREKLLPLKDDIKHIIEQFPHSYNGSSIHLRRIWHERFVYIKWIQTFVTAGLIVFGAMLLMFRAIHLKRRTRWLALFVGIVVVIMTYEVTPSILDSVLSKPAESHSAFVDEFDFVPGVQFSDRPDQVVAVEKPDLRPEAREACVLILRGDVVRIPRERVPIVSTRPSPSLNQPG